MQCTSRRNRTLTGVSVCVCMCVYMWMCIATALSFRIRSISEWYLNAWQKVTEAELSEWKEMHINSLRIDTFHTAKKRRFTQPQWESERLKRKRNIENVSLYIWLSTNFCFSSALFMSLFSPLLCFFVLLYVYISLTSVHSVRMQKFLRYSITSLIKFCIFAISRCSMCISTEYVCTDMHEIMYMLCVCNVHDVYIFDENVR